MDCGIFVFGILEFSRCSVRYQVMNSTLGVWLDPEVVSILAFSLLLFSAHSSPGWVEFLCNRNYSGTVGVSQWLSNAIPDLFCVFTKVTAPFPCFGFPFCK